MYELSPRVLSLDLARAILEPIRAERRDAKFDRYGVVTAQEETSRLSYPLPRIKLSPIREPTPIVERRRIRKWRAAFSQWDKSCLSPTPSACPKLRKRAYKGIPEGARGEAWLRLLGAWDRMLACESQASRSDLGYAVSHPEESAYGAALRTPVSIDVQSAIGRDVRRTFHGFAVLESRAGLLVFARVLLASAAAMPRVGFVQGMSTMAAVLLNYLPEADAFHAFTALLNRQHFARCFSRGMPGLMMRCWTLDQLLARHVPRWARVVAHAGGLLGPSPAVFWATRFLLTFFFRDFPFALAARLFDRYLVDGDVVVYRTLVALILRELRGPLCRTQRRLDRAAAKGRLPSLASPALGVADNRPTIVQRLSTLAERVSADTAQALLDEEEALTEITEVEVLELYGRWQAGKEGRDAFGENAAGEDRMESEARRLRQDPGSEQRAQELVDFLCHDVVFDDSSGLCGAVTEQDARDLIGLGTPGELLPDCGGDAGLMLSLLRARRSPPGGEELALRSPGHCSTGSELALNSFSDHEARDDPDSSLQAPHVCPVSS